MAQIRLLPVAAVACAAALFASVALGAQSPQGTKESPKENKTRPHGNGVVRQAQTSKPPQLACGTYLAFQVLLDSQGFSVGEIDNQPGPNLSHALSAFQSSRKLPASGEANCDSWRALGGDTGGEATVSYQITDDDAKGPFNEKIPAGLPDQAALPALGYRSPIEALAEKFHASPSLLQQLNPGSRFSAGTAIKVPAVTPFDVNAPKPNPDPAMADVLVTVTRDESTVRVSRPDGTLVFFAPVTTGSERDPLPLGDWHVTAVSWKPTFHYDPDLFWDAKASDSKATLKPGPNNPVGITWIDVNIEHYGIHGTPEPGRVGHTESHGCVRLTNWDAARLAALVRPGTQVQFR